MKPDYKQTAVGSIPKDWGVTSLSDIATVVRGGSPRPAGDPRYFNGNFIPWLTVAALTNIPDSTLCVTDTAAFLTEEGSKHSRILQKGTLIIANSGATLGVAKILGIECCANDGIAALINQIKGNKRFICHYFNTQTKHLREVVATGNGQPNLNTKLIGEILVPFPTPSEQRVIVEALDDVDKLISALDVVIAKKCDLTQAVMQQLLTGKQRLPGYIEAWGVKLLGEVTNIDPDNLRVDTDPDFAFNYISLEDVDWGRLNGYSEQVFRTAPSRARRKLQKGDVLFSTVRPNLKSHLFFSEEGQHWICSTGFSVVRAKAKVTSPGYVFFQLFGDRLSRQIDTLLTGSNYPAINSADVQALEIPIPSYEEQTAIAAVLSDMDAEVAALEQRQEKIRTLKQAMMQELLTGKTRLI